MRPGCVTAMAGKPDSGDRCRFDHENCEFQRRAGKRVSRRSTCQLIARVRRTKGVISSILHPLHRSWPRLLGGGSETRDQSINKLAGHYCLLSCRPEKYIFKYIVGAREAKTLAMTRGWGLDVCSIARSITPFSRVPGTPLSAR